MITDTLGNSSPLFAPETTAIICSLCGRCARNTDYYVKSQHCAHKKPALMSGNIGSYFLFRINLSLGSYGGIDKNSSRSVGCLILSGGFSIKRFSSKEEQYETEKNQYQQMQGMGMGMDMQGFQPQLGPNPYPQPQGQGSQMMPMQQQMTMPMQQGQQGFGGGSPASRSSRAAAAFKSRQVHHRHKTFPACCRLKSHTLKIFCG